MDTIHHLKYLVKLFSFMSCLQQIFAPEIVFSNFSLEFGEFEKKKIGIRWQSFQNDLNFVFWWNDFSIREIGLTQTLNSLFSSTERNGYILKVLYNHKTFFLLLFFVGLPCLFWLNLRLMYRPTLAWTGLGHDFGLKLIKRTNAQNLQRCGASRRVIRFNWLKKI